MNYFYGTLITQEIIQLDAEEIRHCTKVLRHKAGDSVQVLDGKGGMYDCLLEQQSLKSGLVYIQKVIYKEETNKNGMNLFVSPTKNADRIEWLVEKAVEIGVKKIAFIYCDRTERKRMNLERVTKIAISAMKQSKQLFLPEIEEYKFKESLNTIPNEVPKYIAACPDGFPKTNVQAMQGQEKIALWVGPEGDFTNAEYEMALQKGLVAMDLGKQRFRTETAALYAITAHSVLA